MSGHHHWVAVYVFSCSSARWELHIGGPPLSRFFLVMCSHQERKHSHELMNMNASSLDEMGLVFGPPFFFSLFLLILWRVKEWDHPANRICADRLSAVS